jgi:hypothetical protein
VQGWLEEKLDSARVRTVPRIISALTDRSRRYALERFPRFKVRLTGLYSRAQFLLTVSLVALLLTRGARIELTIGIQLTDTADKTCNIKLH